MEITFFTAVHAQGQTLRSLATASCHTWTQEGPIIPIGIM